MKQQSKIVYTAVLAAIFIGLTIQTRNFIFFIVALILIGLFISEYIENTKY